MFGKNVSVRPKIKDKCNKNLLIWIDLRKTLLKLNKLSYLQVYLSIKFS